MTRRSLFFTLAAGLLALSLGRIEDPCRPNPSRPTTFDHSCRGNNTVAGSDRIVLSFTFAQLYSDLHCSLLRRVSVSSSPTGNGVGFSQVDFRCSRERNRRLHDHLTWCQPPAGGLINDRRLSGPCSISAQSGSTGVASIGENLTNNVTHAPIGTLSISDLGTLPTVL